ncbi:MAG: SpoIIE family protein phosphatase [Bacteroidales bacterium]|nr:SpoIIE family protein phosphatase [Bacteroidales bacterium]
MSRSYFFIDLGHHICEKHGNIVSGDVFLYRKIQAENRIIAILSDGLGSGVKANVLASMTASMGLNFTEIREPLERMAEFIISTLPVDSERMISYASFTIIDIDFEGLSRIIEFGNPHAVVFRNGEICQIERKAIAFKKAKTNHQEMWLTEFYALRDDRIIFFSDGVTQSGMGNATFPFGWDRANVVTYIKSKLSENDTISASLLSKTIVRQALKNDIYKAQDDTSCAVVYFRKPRNLLVCSGPPYHEKDDDELVNIYLEFQGKRIICGGTTAKIIAKGCNEQIEMDLDFAPSGIPPVSYMKSAALVTEGIITLGRVAKILEEYETDSLLDNNAATESGEGIIESRYDYFYCGHKDQ